MVDIKIVSGANWGDEGKGLVTNALTIPNTLIVLCSNSCQRGHTVVHDGKRHVFRHFGSGTFKGAATYLTDDFMINPAMFRQELEALWNMDIYPKVYYRPSCLIVTPYDMLANQVIEDARGDKRFGSCGCGAWETRVRKLAMERGAGYNSGDLTLEHPTDFMQIMIPKIADYYAIHRLPNSERMAEFNTAATINHLNDDIQFFLRHTTPICGIMQEKSLFNSYDRIIFENSQGLLLDTAYNMDIDHTTPAHVGASIPNKIITRVYGNSNDKIPNIEAIYITRTYFTRHGNGPMGEYGDCSAAVINPFMWDKTNVPNPWQGTLRYGRMSKTDIEQMYQRIVIDSTTLWAHNHEGNIETSLVVTHVNEFYNEKLFDYFDKVKTPITIYESYNETDIVKRGIIV